MPLHLRPLFASIALGAALVAQTADAQETIRSLPAGDLPWVATPEGVAFAALVGDRFAEPYMAMVRLPAGTVSPPHVKSANMFGVIVSGTMTHVPASGDSAGEVALEAGAFYQVPAGLAHVSSCVSDVDCVTFLYQDGKFDFLPTGQ